ncbi:hypothetical protein AAVH_37276, partial [Aphelenchoides avenae]
AFTSVAGHVLAGGHQRRRASMLAGDHQRRRMVRDHRVTLRFVSRARCSRSAVGSVDVSCPRWSEERCSRWRERRRRLLPATGCPLVRSLGHRAEVISSRHADSRESDA